MEDHDRSLQGQGHCHSAPAPTPALHHITSDHDRVLPRHLRFPKHSVLDTTGDHYNQLMVRWYVIISSNHIYYNLSFDYLNFGPSDFCARLICRLHSFC